MAPFKWKHVHLCDVLHIISSCNQRQMRSTQVRCFISFPVVTKDKWGQPKWGVSYHFQLQPRTNEVNPSVVFQIISSYKQGQMRSTQEVFHIISSCTKETVLPFPCREKTFCFANISTLSQVCTAIILINSIF